MAELARKQVVVQDEVTRIKPAIEGVPVNVVKLEFKENEDKPEYSQLAVTFRQEADEKGIVRESTVYLPNPYSGEEKYIPTNIAKYLMLFGCLSDVNIKEAETAAGGYFPEHKAFVEQFKTYLAPNWETIPCQVMLVYPLKAGKPSKFLGLPTVGRFITSPKHEGDLVEFNEAYHSLAPGAGDDAKPEQRNNNTPARQTTGEKRRF